MPRRELTRVQALAWNSAWSYTDREIIEEHLDRLEAVTFYKVESGSYIGCLNAAGKRVMSLWPGYITFARGLGPEVLADPNWEGIDLSTARYLEGERKTARREQESCPVHGMPILANIGCESCE
ncbi:MAG: hypothetical protein EOO27_05235 [Comamonadaceae bacterium]|nr:MAG: hypothetical protein EOO27_05235 [Comamonadaceae bacterium]